MVKYYQKTQQDLEDKFGTLRGQISYGVLELLRRSRIWMLLFALTAILLSLFSLARPLLPYLGIDYYTTEADSKLLSWFASAFSIGVLALAITVFRIAASIKTVVLSADASEVETLLARMRWFWILAFLFVFVTLLIWVGAPFLSK